MKTVHANTDHLKESGQGFVALTKNVLVLFLLVFSLSVGGSLAACGSSEPSDSGTDGSGAATSGAVAEDTMTVHVTIDCTAAVDADIASAKAASDDGIIFDGTVELPVGATVDDALIATGVDVGTTSSSMGSYVSSIDGLAEKDAGETSGWTYYLNDEAGSVASSECELSDGDSVEWRFVLEF